MDRLTPHSNFSLWKLRAIPTLVAKATKLGIKEPRDLLPTLLDDTLCIVYGQWLAAHTTATLDEAVDYLEQWMLEDKNFTSRAFYERQWRHGEALEEFVADLEVLAMAQHISTADRAFKLRLIEGFPPEIQPFLRLEIKGATWPSVTKLVEKAKMLKIKPSQTVHATTDQSQEAVAAVINPTSSSASSARVEGGGSREPFTSPQCFNCGGYGHVARLCPSPHQDRATNSQRSTRGQYNRQWAGKDRRL
jgi:hypothetical protein